VGMLATSARRQTYVRRHRQHAPNLVPAASVGLPELRWSVLGELGLPHSITSSARASNDPHVDAERLGGLAVDEFGRQLDRKITRFLSIENPGDLIPGPGKALHSARSVAHQAPARVN
jgi:hypothetical protein